MSFPAVITPVNSLPSDVSSLTLLLSSFGSAIVSVSPHLVHVLTSMPSSVSVGSLVILPSSYVCPVAGKTSVLTSPHLLQIYDLTPSLVHVGSVVILASP